ncbi:GntR family transcriptional regulator [Paracoccus zhejiangensis]|nr:GntR family transcriptional regulator [Paracoccus zhejiangensis]
MSRLPAEAATGLRGVSPELAGRSTTTWQAVRNEVLARIRSQEWSAGKLIPTEKQLATEWGCARATVNRALRDLAENGIVERRRKVGTRVSASPSLKASREISAIRSDIQALGAAFSYRLLRSERIGAPSGIARNLQIASGDPVQYVNAAFLADQVPYCCQVTWLNIAALPDLDGVDLSEGSAEEWLEHAIHPNHGRIAIMALPIEEGSAETMNLRPGTPVLTIERTDWSDSTPVAFSRQSFPPGHRLVYDR